MGIENVLGILPVQPVLGGFWALILNNPNRNAKANLKD